VPVGCFYFMQPLQCGDPMAARIAGIIRLIRSMGICPEFAQRG
jgi:hypothetical protein